LLALSEAQVSANAFQDAMDNAMRAIEIARARGFTLLFGRATLDYTLAQFNAPTDLVGYRVRSRNSVAFIDEAFSLPGGLPIALRAALLGAQSFALSFVPDIDRAKSVAREAVELSREVDDVGMRCHALTNAHAGLGSPDTLPERVAIARESLQAVEQGHDDGMRFRALAQLGEDLLELGDVDGAAGYVHRANELALRSRSPIQLWAATAGQAMLCLLRGELAEAERLMGVALAEGQRTQSGMPVIMFGAQLFDLRHLQGRLAELEGLARSQFQTVPEAVGNNNAINAFILAESGRPAEAREFFDILAADRFAVLPHDQFFLVALYLGGEVCAELEDVDRAAQLYDLLLPYANQNITVPLLFLCVGSASRTLGMMATLMERYGDAEHHFEYALAFDQKMKAPPWVAHTEYSYAKMLIARDAPGDKAKALALLQHALDTAQELGMAKIIERGLALKLEAQGATGSGIYTSIDAVARAVAQERPDAWQQALAPDGTVTLMFSDIEDSTVLTERLGDQAWQELLRKHNALIRDQLRAHGGYEVKTMGDGFMVAFQSAKKGLDCAISIQRAFDTSPPSPLSAGGEGESRVKVRIGLHAGEAIKDGDDFYGKNVILASRVAGKANGGEILVSSLLRQLVESSTDAALFGEPREMELKGLAGTHTVFGVRWAGPTRG
jgi:class 3 adenylate cyclase